MRKILAGLILLLASLGPALAQTSFPPVGTQLTKFFTATQSITRTFPAVSGKSIYLTQLTVSGTAAGVFTLSTGTGTNCGTNTVVVYTETLIAGTPIAVGDGAGVVAVIGPNLDVCITVATQSLSGWVSIAQF